LPGPDDEDDRDCQQQQDGGVGEAHDACP
jgi:hypothetical protein